MKYDFGQLFNNGSAKNYGSIDTTALVMTDIVALMPDGVSIFAPTITGTVGVAVPQPTTYKEIKVSCIDKTAGGAYQSSIVSVPFAKATLTDDLIRSACLGKVDTPNDTVCDKVNIVGYRQIGA